MCYWHFQWRSKLGRQEISAIGFRVHSGWAALVAVAGPFQSVVVVHRAHIKLADPAIKGSVQPYHAAERLEIHYAERLLERCADSSRRLASEALRQALDDLRKKGYTATGCGLLLASGRPLPGLAATLASHALIHTAEGEFFREAVAYAGQSIKLPIFRIKERELLGTAGAKFRISPDELGRRLTELGKTLGPPWRQDEKYAALVASLALADSGA
jgi:hypothetical protein